MLAWASVYLYEGSTLAVIGNNLWACVDCCDKIVETRGRCLCGMYKSRRVAPTAVAHVCEKSICKLETTILLFDSFGLGLVACADVKTAGDGRS